MSLSADSQGTAVAPASATAGNAGTGPPPRRPARFELPNGDEFSYTRYASDVALHERLSVAARENALGLWALDFIQNRQDQRVYDYTLQLNICGTTGWYRPRTSLVYGGRDSFMAAAQSIARKRGNAPPRIICPVGTVSTLSPEEEYENLRRQVEAAQ